MIYRGTARMWPDNDGYWTPYEYQCPPYEYSSLQPAHPHESNEPREAPPQGQHPSGHKQEQDDER